MAENNKFTTKFQDLTKALIYGFDKNVETQAKKVNSYILPTNNDIIFKTDNPAELEMTKNQMKQQKFLAQQWYKSGQNLSQQTSLVTNNLKLMYRDCDLMDGYPLIGAALDLFMEETCLFEDTKIKLLNGETYTVKELYEENKENFWVYSISESGIDCKPSKIDKVIYKGVKPLFKLILDDGTEIKCTDNHKWLKSNNEWVETKNIVEGDSLMSIYDSINYLGYERVITTNGTKLLLTHRMVGNELLRDEKLELSKNNFPHQKLVIHHKSFNKLNNDPSQLTWMYWDDHQKLHTDLNTSRWENEEFADKMRIVMSKSIKNTWKTKRDEMCEKFSKGQKEKISKMTQEERNNYYGRKGEQNGMYGSKRFGNLNPNYDKTKNHIEDINIEEYINFNVNIKDNTHVKSSMEEFNMCVGEVYKLNVKICSDYNIKKITQLKYKILSKYDIQIIKDYIRQGLPKFRISKILNIYYDEIKKVLTLNGYKSWDDLVTNVNNHRIIKIEKIGEGDVYDLVNSSNNNCFGVKCNKGQIISHNCTTNTKGHIINIHSSSKRIKNVLEDLFVNRLDSHVNLPMWTRAMCKYGNCFVMLHITDENGVIGSRVLPVYEMERVENGTFNPYVTTNLTNSNPEETQFIWTGKNEPSPFKNWQIAHFRLLTDSIFLPFGISVLHKARRHWRMLSMMEDMMLIYRLERSIERRVFKVFVGNIDDADIPAFVQEVGNSIKRTPIIDPQTGQLDLRKTSLAVSDDYIIPVKSETTAMPIETLAAASNLDKIEDLKFIQNQVMTALRVPGEFLNFEQSAGNGKNLALKDIRFTRTINRIQQALIMELTKIATIHLYLLGFEDEITNFKITMNSPSTQSEILKLEELSKKISLATDAVRDTGKGLQLMSLTRAKREIMGWSDEEITEDMLLQRMESALASEMNKTEQIIKRTGFFDKIDKLYGEPNAEYVLDGIDEAGGDMGGGAGGGGGASFEDSFGGEGDMGGESPDMGGGELPPIENAAPETGGEAVPAMESMKKKVDNLLLEAKTIQKESFNKRRDSFFKSYIEHVKKGDPNNDEESIIIPIYSKNFLVNEETMSLSKEIDKFLSKGSDVSKDFLTEVKDIKPKKKKKLQ